MMLNPPDGMVIVGQARGIGGELVGARHDCVLLKDERDDLRVHGRAQ